MKKKHYNEGGFLVDEHGTHGLAGSLYCPCHDKNCEDCCPCKEFGGDCKDCVDYYKHHKTPDQVMCEKVKDETLDEVVELIENLGWSAAGWGHVVNMINEQLRTKNNKKILVTEHEIKIIRNACFHPDGRACDKPLCEYYNKEAHACKFNISDFIQSIINLGENNE